MTPHDLPLSRVFCSLSTGISDLTKISRIARRELSMRPPRCSLVAMVYPDRAFRDPLGQPQGRSMRNASHKKKSRDAADGLIFRDS